MIYLRCFQLVAVMALWAVTATAQNDLNMKNEISAAAKERMTNMFPQAEKEWMNEDPEFVALHQGVSPVEEKEIVYQATAYLGMGRVMPFINATNEVLKAEGVNLPLAPQAQTSMQNRREKGTEAQVGCFGEGMKDFWKSGPDDSRHINKWLADNCFGDWYTRTGLDLKMRELITFCFLAAQGGCEPQLKGHIAGNYHVGNNKDFLIAVISSNLPFIGYPRTLNALNCIREVEAANK